MSTKTASFTLGASVRHTPTEQVGIVEQILPGAGGGTWILFHGTSGSSFPATPDEFVALPDPEEVTDRAAEIDATTAAGADALSLARAEYVVLFIRRL
ncbi:MAG: hypothetical protein WCJ66_09790, partial [Verrucomicrobiota bacterium]